MAGKDIFMVSQREVNRLHIIKKALDKKLKQREAAEILLLSDRQIRRIIKRIRAEGNEGIVHKSRGKESNRGIPKKIKDKAIKLYREKYQDFGPTLASEKLMELDGITITDETLRKWLIETGDWKKVRKVRGHRQWRERKHHFGEMVQMDGSHHDWFEGRGPKCVFMGYIDDATGETFGRFYEYEGTMPAMDSIRNYMKKYGIPVSVYLDRHTTYKSPAKASLTEIEEPMSQFERAMKELGIRVIHAHSPQAKGRVERLFKTLQDRMIKEMRLKGIKSVEEGNMFLKEYLPLYNKKFAVVPMEKADLHREISKEVNLRNILCIKTERVLRNDFTVAYNSKLYQIKDKTKATKVVVIERINGSMAILDKDVSLPFKEIIERPKKEQKRRVVNQRKRQKPAPDHPWGFKHAMKKKMIRQKVIKLKAS